METISSTMLCALPAVGGILSGIESPRSSQFLLIACVICFATPLGAQDSIVRSVSTAPPFASRAYASREQLERDVLQAEAQRRTAEAWLLRSRLQNGDFQEGDRIVIELEGAGAVTDTLQVRAGRVLQLPQMDDLSLSGVLRSELTDTLRHHLSRYLRNPAVRATPLLPLAITGSVRSPGYYYSAADVVLRDVIMAAGGPLGTADLDRVIVRRGGEVIWDASSVRTALSDGLSVDRLHLRAGDEVFVPERRRFQLSTVAMIISSATAVIFGIVQAAR